MTCLKNIKSVLSAGRSPCVSVYVRVWLWCLCVCALTLPRSALINGKVSNWRVSIIPKWRIQGGAPNARPPTAQNFLDFMQFLGKFDKIVCWCPLEGRHPLLQGIPRSAPVPVHTMWQQLQLQLTQVIGSIGLYYGVHMVQQPEWLQLK